MMRRLMVLQDFMIVQNTAGRVGMPLCRAMHDAGNPPPRHEGGQRKPSSEPGASHPATLTIHQVPSTPVTRIVSNFADSSGVWNTVC